MLWVWVDCVSSCGSSASVAMMAWWCPQVSWVWSGVSTAECTVCFFDFFDVFGLFAVCVCVCVCVCVHD